MAPLNDRIRAADKSGYDHYGIQPDWNTYRQYFARLEKQGIGINVADYVGATQVRRVVIGDDDRKPTPAELERMKQLVREAMADGGGGSVDVAAVRAGTLRHYRRTGRAGRRGGQGRRHLCDAHAQRRRRGDPGDRRSHPHRPRGVAFRWRSGI